jgi:hypothetical protein
LQSVIFSFHKRKIIGVFYRYKNNKNCLKTKILNFVLIFNFKNRMKKLELLIAFCFFSSINLFSQNIDSMDIELVTERIQHSTDTTEIKNYWQFMLNISKKRLAKKFFWADKSVLITNMYKLNYSLDTIEYHLLDFMDKDPIHACNETEWKRTLALNFKKTYMDKHKKFYAKLDCRCKEEYAKLDSNLIRLLVVMDSFDQKYRKNGSDAPWFPANKDKWIEQGHYDAYNEALLEHIFKNYGFPSYRKIGAGEITFIPFDVSLHSSVEFQQKYLPLLKIASENDDVPKHFFAQAQDRILMLKGQAQIYGTQLVWNNKAEVLELYKVKDMSKIDKWRDEVDLCKLSSYLKAQKAIIPSKKN